MRPVTADDARQVLERAVDARDELRPGLRSRCSPRVDPAGARRRAAAGTRASSTGARSPRGAAPGAARSRSGAEHVVVVVLVPALVDRRPRSRDAGLLARRVALAPRRAPRRWRARERRSPRGRGGPLRSGRRAATGPAPAWAEEAAVARVLGARTRARSSFSPGSIGRSVPRGVAKLDRQRSGADSASAIAR